MSSLHCGRIPGHTFAAWQAGRVSRCPHRQHISQRMHTRRKTKLQPAFATPAVQDICIEAPVQPASTPIPTEASQQQRHAARLPSDLRDPVKIGAKGHASVKVPLYSEPVTLKSYMMLPVEQYNLLDPKQIRHLDGNRFLLHVPRINLFNIWIEPEVEMVVITPSGDDGASKRVVLQAENCRINGSGAIEKLRLDQRFCMRFTTELTWDDDSGPRPDVSTPAASEQQQQQQQQRTQQKQPKPSIFRPLQQALKGRNKGEGSSQAVVVTDSSGWAPASSDDGQMIPAVATGFITGASTLEVWSEVIPPFHLMPRQLLEGTSNAVMRGLINTLLPLFLKDLAADWAKWAANPTYRAERAQRSAPSA